jgi:hypothetical protein
LWSFVIFFPNLGCLDREKAGNPGLVNTYVHNLCATNCRPLPSTHLAPGVKKHICLVCFHLCVGRLVWKQGDEKSQSMSRVTRMGEFSPSGRLFSLGFGAVFSKIKEVCRPKLLGYYYQR